MNDPMYDPLGTIAEIFGHTVLERDFAGKTRVIHGDGWVLDTNLMIITVTLSNGKIAKYDWRARTWSLVS